jgi:hypothetical protein
MKSHEKGSSRKLDACLSVGRPPFPPLVSGSLSVCLCLSVCPLSVCPSVLPVPLSPSLSASVPFFPLGIPLSLCVLSPLS